MRSSKLLGCSLSFQISGGIVEFLSEIILLLGTDTGKPAEQELQPWGKNASWSLGVMRGRRRSVANSSFVPWFLGHVFWLLEKTRSHIIHWLQASRGTYSNLMRWCLSGSTGAESSSEDDLAF